MLRCAPNCGFQLVAAAAMVLLAAASGTALDYVVPDTDQTLCFDTTTAIDPPDPGQAFYGQDAQFYGPASPPRPTLR
ncbi:hypothetical protein GF402_06710 [Candidatus Fermentibacteria bacterium]|nr:hypothetical protein [Candidatus Fermentibacteria bacterium]